MLNELDLVAFITTADAAEAKRFYGEVLGLRFVEDGPFALVFDAHGTTLRIQKVERVAPPKATVLGWSAPDLDATMDALISRGVAFERFEGLPQDEKGIWTAPGGARVAWFRDPDGNLLSLAQEPTSA
ncbi:MAG TPA: VOC family protein [Thermoanaerobaculia bacterium]|nr:VOC family protein [Thermoanaerobaculia bacterium]